MLITPDRITQKDIFVGTNCPGKKHGKVETKLLKTILETPAFLGAQRSGLNAEIISYLSPDCKLAT